MANFAQRRAARESIENTEPGEIDGLSNVEPGVENLDTQLAEMASEDAQLEGLAGDQDTLGADTARTEDAIDDAQDAIDNGEEQSEESIAHTEVAQESIRRRWGIDRTKLARESFRRGRGMTAAAQEGWKETLKDLWKRFLELIKSIVNKIKELKLKYINVGKTAQNRAKKYQAAIKNLGSKKTKDEIGGSWISKLSIEGAFNVDGSIGIAKEVTQGKAKGAIAAMTKQADAAATYVVKAADGEVSASKASGGSASNGPGVMLASDAPTYDKIELFGTAATKLQNLEEFADGEYQKLQALPGNAYIQVGNKKLAGGVDFAAIGFMTTGDATEDKQVATPELGKLTAAAQGLDAIGKGFEKVLQDFRTFDSEVEKLQRAAEKASGAVDKADDANREALQSARTAADQSVKNYQVLNRAVAYVANTVIAGLNGYIGAGIGAYGKK
ncbi:hypothetical protein pSALSNUABM04_060 [Salmonella phage pSal-SNUABM-04]|nr:hypothetical protein pSALSNUABM04_060 [Salmonella phage pSal-SNUABM-04]